jgi:phosphoribosylanthranilate isomerase
MDVKLKICGMAQAANIAAVAALQPDYMGFIFYKNSPRCISQVSSELIKYVPSAIKTTGVFVNEQLENIQQSVALFNLKAVQLHGSETPDLCTQLKQMGVEVIKAFGIGADFDFDQLTTYLNSVDYFLFDTQTPAHGGSGKVFDWSLLSSYNFEKPFFLSGGIDLIHAKALNSIQNRWLYAIDINSKFELEPGLKNVKKIKEFMQMLSLKQH